MLLYPCAKIAIDSQGGGRAVLEALHDPDKIRAEFNEQPLWPVIIPDKPEPTDSQQGLHILEIISFADAKWTKYANESLKKDMEDKAILFPEFNSAILGLALEDDKASGFNKKTKKKDVELRSVEYDSLEDCMLEIEELKNELCNINLIHTDGGRERWDTPQIAIPGSTKKGRLKKDRYSALLMANSVARDMKRVIVPIMPKMDLAGGGFAHSIEQKTNQSAGRMFTGPEWTQQKMDFFVVRRN